MGIGKVLKKEISKGIKAFFVFNLPLNIYVLAENGLDFMKREIQMQRIENGE